MGFIWSLIVGEVIGVIAGAVTNRDSSVRVIANVVADLVGSALGQALLDSWGLSIAGMAIVPSLISAIILVLIVSLSTRKLQKDF